MAKGKKYKTALEKIERGKRYPVKEAVELLKSTAFETFPASVECAIRLNLDPRKADQNLRGALVLPHGTGKTKRVLVFAKGDKAKEAEAAGADHVGDEELAEKISGGWTDFDTVVATPDMMSHVGKLGRILGPKGLMPNPKTGTVTMDIQKAVEEIKAGKVEYRTDKVGNIHVTLGKIDFEADKLLENLRAFYDLMIKSRPATVKGVFVQNLSIATTMGPGIKIDPASVISK